MPKNQAVALAIIAMASVIISSNFLVQVPVPGTLGPLILPDILTFGAFTYPLAFLVTDLTNRALGPREARKVVIAGFVIAVITPIALEQVADLPPSTTRVVLASATAFLIAQFLDIAIFNRLRFAAWWRPPLVSSVVGSALDTAIFFTLAFTALITFEVDAFAVAAAPLFGLEGNPEAPRWVSWALADFVVKMMIAAVALIPFRLFIAYTLTPRRVA